MRLLLFPLSLSPTRFGRTARRALTVAAFFCISSVVAGPVARCIAAEHDFGQAAAGTALRHVFNVTNTGDSRLTLRVAVTCCGSKVSLPASTLAPGRSTEVSVEITLPSRPGVVRRAVYLATNDPSTPYLRLCLAGRVPEAGETNEGQVTETVKHAGDMKNQSRKKESAENQK